MDTHSSYLGSLVVTLLEVSERDEAVVALHLPIGPLKPPLWVGVGTSPLAGDAATVSVSLKYILSFIISIIIVLYIQQ